MMTPQRLGRTFLLTVGLGCAAALAGTFNFDFNSDPATVLDFCGTAWDGSATSNTGSASWVASGGAGPVGNTAAGSVAGVPGDGFLRLTFASPDCSGALSSSLCGGVLFNDFDMGLVVAGFMFECDLRIGNGSVRLADGFSLSYVRVGDPVLQALAAGDTLPNMNHWISAHGGQFADNGSAGDLSLIEEGTQTGLSIGFDLWASGGYTIPPAPPAVGKVAPGLTQDDIGLDVRVDGTLLTTIPMPNLEPVSGDDPTSIVTGPYDGTGCDTNLAWVHFKVELDTAGVLNVWYKNTCLLTNFATRYYPSPGRLLLAARVGAATANIEVDNIQITTLPASEVAIGPVSGTATGFSLSVADSGPAVVDPATVQVRLNGTPITPAVSKSGGTTTIRYVAVEPFPPGTTNTVTVSLKQTNGQQVDPVGRTYVVPGLGTLKWVADAGFAIGSCPALGADGTVYVGSNDGKLHALDGATGAKKWAAAIGASINSSPALGADGTVYVGSGSGELYALDGATGAHEWAFATVSGGPAGSSPAIGADGTVYVGSYDGKLYALNGVSGARKWAAVTGGWIISSPAIGADGTVYVGSHDGRVYGIDGATGAQKWAFATGGVIASSPAVDADSMVYFGSDDGSFFALDGATGAHRWVYGRSLPFCYSSPALGADGTAFVGTFGDAFVALAGNITSKWGFVLGGSVCWSSPAVAADGTVYIGAEDSKLYALDGATGARKWTFTTSGGLASPTIGADGTVYVASADSKVYAIVGSAPLANTPWPKFRGNAQNTGRQFVVAPMVLRQPSRVVLAEGATGKIAVKVAGEPVPALRWSFNGEPILGATQATLTIPSVTRRDEGTYTLVVSNAVGQVTGQPILALVSNADPQSFLGLQWEGGTAGPVSLETTAQLGDLAPWHSISNYPPSATPQVYVELDPADAARFYRLNGADRVETLRAAFIPGWWFTQPAGTTQQIEYVSAAAGWTNWQVLTNLTLPSSPHLFLDTAAFEHPGGVYRTTPVQ